jgi:DNA primase
MSTWIDFKQLREQLDFIEVLKRYGVEPRIKGRQHHGFCPLPTHNGKRRSPSFSVNLEKRIWQCFGCGAKGNIIDFAVRMEGLDPERGEDVREVALKLRRELLGVPDEEPPRKERPSAKAPPASETSKRAPAAAEMPDAKEKTRVANAPLDFELKHLDPAHPYLMQRGLSPETIQAFGLGFCDRGLMKGRIAIPLHDRQRRLIGYAGRLANEADIGPEQPKYRFPSEREKDGVVYEFHKSLFLYNAHRLEKPVRDLILVEGFPSVWWLHQNGFRHVAAIMGSSCSDEQAAIAVELTAPDGRIFILPDADEAGGRCAESMLTRLAPHRFVRWLRLPDGKQPTDLSADGLRAMMSS